MTTPHGVRGQATRPLVLALGQLVVMAAVLGGVEASLTPGGPLNALLLPVMALVFVGAGTLAWGRRPHNRLGPLLCAGGAVLLLFGLGELGPPVLTAVGLVTATLVIGVVVHALLAFPSGRLRHRAPRVVAGLGYLGTTVLQVPLYLFGNPVERDNPLQLADRPDVVAVAGAVSSTVAALTLLGVGVVLVQRVRRASPAQRRSLLPVYGYCATALLAVSFAANLDRLGLVDPPVRFLAQAALLAGVPVAFTAGILRGGFARTAELEELAGWLGSAERARGELGAALARTLGDPSLVLAFPASDPHDDLLGPAGAGRVDGGADGGDAGGGGLIDAAGRPVHLAPDRGRVPVELGERVVGVIGYDATLLTDPEPVRAAGRVVAIAVDRGRLTARLLHEQEQLRDSRARLVRAGDRERRRLAHDLHDRLQSRLVLLALRVGTLQPGCPQRDLDAVRHEVDEVAAELRFIVQGVMPALLIERGLVAAVEDIASRTALRTELDLAPGSDAHLPPSVEGTAFHVVAEAVTNTVKHAGAEEIFLGMHRRGGVLHLQVRDDGVGGARPAGGSGLRGIADRVDALGGRLHVDSPPAGGTRVRVELPCAS